MRRVFVDGFAMWPATPDAPRPAPQGLAANERRRAPDGVLVALHVAEAAVAMAGADAAMLASVFTSAHGDLAIVDALCRTLAADPLLLSPTRFHHSVHNAASGYWAMAAGCRAPSTAIAAFDHSFAAGWLEAACQVAADERPVLLVGFDTAAVGALASVNRSRGLLGVALVMTPARGPQSRWQVDWALHDEPCERAPLRQHAALAGNAMADALPFVEALSNDGATALGLPLGAQSLALQLQALPAAGTRAAGA